MPIPTVKFAGMTYPAYQVEGNAAQFVTPFAEHLCKGMGIDIGCGKWCLSGALPVDPMIPPHHTAMDYPYRSLDFIFSSHCLEHLDDWVAALNFWYSTLKHGGVLFLYLPDFSQIYWRPWHNRKHKTVFTPEIIRSYLLDKHYTNVFVSGVDLNNSFVAVAEKDDVVD